jgi:hypothetical protein
VRPELIGKHAVEQLIWRMKHSNEKTRATVTIEPEIVAPEPDPMADVVVKAEARDLRG